MTEPRAAHATEDQPTHDHTGAALLVGALMIGGAFLFMWLAVNFAFSVTALVWGSIIVCASLFFRHKSMDKHQRSHDATSPQNADHPRSP